MLNEQNAAASTSRSFALGCRAAPAVTSLAYSFVRAVRVCPGVRRIALLGSLATAKAIPKDVDLLVTVERAMDLTQLARAGQRLK
jgi:predicted nucleotidyltransferase